MKNIRKLRFKADMTQVELSERSGVSQPYINELEHGKKVNPSVIVLSKLAKALEVTISDLIDDDVNEGTADFMQDRGEK